VALASLPVAVALGRLDEGRATQWDPEAVDAFLSIYGDGRADGDGPSAGGGRAAGDGPADGNGRAHSGSMPPA
jgi:hypothetical protein